MSLFAGARWRGPVPNEGTGFNLPSMGLVLHIQQGHEAGTDATFHDPHTHASAHLGVAKDGTLDQWVACEDKAWAEAGGNANWHSIECEGFSGEELTVAQLDTVTRVYTEGHARWGWPLQQSDDPNTRGLGWHGMGGAAWGGHFDCPGQPIKNQRMAILQRVQALIAPQEELSMADVQAILDRLDKLEADMAQLVNARADGTDANVTGRIQQIEQHLVAEIRKDTKAGG